MKIYELYFNPEDKKKVFESLQYKPENAYKRRGGKLYMIGEIISPKEEDLSFLQTIFYKAKEAYYRTPSASPEKAFKETLQEVNNFLKEKEQKNINVALFSSKNFTVYFSAIGNIKAFLLGKKEVKDLKKDLTGSDSFFENMISGKMSRNEKLVVLTSEIDELFLKEKIIEDMMAISFNDQITEKISSAQQEKFPEASGIAFIMDFTTSLKEKERKFISEKPPTENFSFKKLLTEKISSLQKMVKKIKIPKINPKKTLGKIKSITLKEKRLFFPLLFLCVVILGSIAVTIERRMESRRYHEELLLLEEKIMEAKEENDLRKMKKTFYELEAFIEEGNLKEEAEKLSSTLQEDLLTLSSTQKEVDLKKIAKIEEINPSQMVSGEKILYFSSSGSSQISTLYLEDKREHLYSLPGETGVMFTSFSGGRVLFFSSPDIVTSLEGDNFSARNIELPSDHEEFVAFSSFMGSPYFLDSKGRIFNYPEETPLPWIKKEEEYLRGSTSISIDGSIFILTSGNEMYRYYRGEKKEKFNLLSFPPLREVKKVYTEINAPLFLADPKEERLLILSKEGEIEKQIFDEKFKDLRDISVANDGKKIYLLLGKEVYSLDI